MKEFLERCRYALLGVALMMTGNAFGLEKDQAVLGTPRPLASGEVPMPDRIVRSDMVVLGRVVAVEPKDVEAVLSSERPYKLDYRIAVVKVHEVIHGQKDVKELRLGFVSPDQDRAVDKAGKEHALSCRACFSLRQGRAGRGVLSQKASPGQLLHQLRFIQRFPAQRRCSRIHQESCKCPPIE